MREFWQLTWNPDPKLVRVEDYDLGSFDDGDVWEGRSPPGGVPPDVKLWVDGSKQWHDFIQSPMPWMIVSDRFRDVLLPFWGGGTFCPIALHDRRSGQRIDGFWLATMARRIDCMDRERSDFGERNGRLSSLSDLVVLEARVPEDVHAFALADIPWEVILDGTVKQAIWGGGVRGLGLVECGVTGARPGESVPGYLEQYRSPRPSTRRGAKAYRYVLEMQWPYRERTDIDHLIAFWTMLKERFPRRFGRVDRDTFRVDERRGRMRVFVFTDAPERALAESRALVRSSRIAERMSAAYREVEGDAWTRLLPAGSTEPFEE